MAEIDIIDNSPKVKEELKAAIERALWRCGEKAEGYAVDLVRVVTGTLKNSITHAVDTEEQSVYIGTNNEYATYVELGTGKYVEGGRPTPWVYQDSNGKWHHTHGQRAQPYLKPAVADHTQTYRNIIEDELRNG